MMKFVHSTEYLKLQSGTYPLLLQISNPWAHTKPDISKLPTEYCRSLLTAARIERVSHAFHDLVLEQRAHDIELIKDLTEIDAKRKMLAAVRQFLIKHLADFAYRPIKGTEIENQYPKGYRRQANDIDLIVPSFGDCIALSKKLLGAGFSIIGIAASADQKNDPVGLVKYSYRGSNGLAISVEVQFGGIPLTIRRRILYEDLQKYLPIWDLESQETSIIFQSFYFIAEMVDRSTLMIRDVWDYQVLMGALSESAKATLENLLGIFGLSEEYLRVKGAAMDPSGYWGSNPFQPAFRRQFYLNSFVSIGLIRQFLYHDRKSLGPQWQSNSKDIFLHFMRSLTFTQKSLHRYRPLLKLLNQRMDAETTRHRGFLINYCQVDQTEHAGVRFLAKQHLSVLETPLGTFVGASLPSLDI